MLERKLEIENECGVREYEPDVKLTQHRHSSSSKNVGHAQPTKVSAPQVEKVTKEPLQPGRTWEEARQHKDSLKRKASAMEEPATPTSAHSSRAQPTAVPPKPGNQDKQQHAPLKPFKAPRSSSEPQSKGRKPPPPDDDPPGFSDLPEPAP